MTAQTWPLHRCDFLFLRCIAAGWIHFSRCQFSVATANNANPKVWTACVMQNINWSNRSIVSNSSLPFYECAHNIHTGWRVCLRSYFPIEQSDKRFDPENGQTLLIAFRGMYEMCINQSRDVAYVQLCWHSTGGHVKVYSVLCIQDTRYVCMVNHKCIVISSYLVRFTISGYELNPWNSVLYLAPIRYVVHHITCYWFEPLFSLQVEIDYIDTGAIAKFYVQRYCTSQLADEIWPIFLIVYCLFTPSAISFHVQL